MDPILSSTYNYPAEIADEDQNNTSELQMLTGSAEEDKMLLKSDKEDLKTPFYSNFKDGGDLLKFGISI